MFETGRILLIATIVFCVGVFGMIQDTNAYGNEGESIVYVIKPLGGRVEYSDLGLTDLTGRPVNLSVFKTATFGFKDTEKIYSDPDTLLPVRVEREVHWWFGREDLIEEYDQKDFKVTITKYKGKKKVSEQVLTADGPISNAILVPFNLRRVTDIDLGWSFIFRLPQKYEAKLVSLDDITVNGHKFSAYHFTSTPYKFEIWISKDDARLPLKIKGMGGFNYTLLMKEHKTAACSR